jgi:iduronate 2-sulfatase
VLLPTRLAVALCLAPAALLGSRCLAQTERPPRHNVLFVIADDLTAETLSCYGSPWCKTPAIDRLAARGTVFTRAYSQFPVCGPARAALMTGARPASVGVTGNGSSGRLSSILGDRPTLPGLFRSAGWHTARVSKIFHMRVPGDITKGVDGDDHPPSWTERFNVRAPEWQTAGEARHLSHERLRFEPDTHYNLGFGTAFYAVRAESDGAEQADVLAADRAVELLAGFGGEPFFLAVGFVRPHVPLVAPGAYFDAHDLEDMDPPNVPEGDQDDIPAPGLSLTSQRTKLTDPARKREVIQAYSAAVAFMDDQLGRVLDALEKHGHADDTIVVFTSDHGYHLGEHDLWQKLSLHEESVRVPLIVARPGDRPAQRSALAEQIDIYPTLAELAGLATPEHVEGRSLVPVLDDETASVRDAAFSRNGRGHLIRTERFAYLAWNDGSAELYDMEVDPGQFRNLADDPDHAEIARELASRLETENGVSGGPPRPPASGRPTPGRRSGDAPPPDGAPSGGSGRSGG